MDGETTGIILSAGTVSSLCTLAGLWIKAKFGQKTKVENDPLNVKKVPGYVTLQECQQHRCALEKRIDELGPALNRIFEKLSESERKSEERSCQLHRRLDPIVEKTAANSQAIEMFKDFAMKSTVGGKK